jgi:hypothetical protein
MWPTMRFSAGVLPRSDASLAKATAISGFCRGVASSSAISSVLWKKSSHAILGTSVAFSYIFTVIISSAKIRIRDEITKFYQCFFYEMRKIVDTQWSFFTQNKVTEYILGNKEQRNSDIFS